MLRSVVNLGSSGWSVETTIQTHCAVRGHVPVAGLSVFGRLPDPVDSAGRNVENVYERLLDVHVPAEVGQPRAVRRPDWCAHVDRVPVRRRLDDQPLQPPVRVQQAYAVGAFVVHDQERRTHAVSVSGRRRHDHLGREHVYLPLQPPVQVERARQLALFARLYIHRHEPVVHRAVDPVAGPSTLYPLRAVRREGKYLRAVL